MSIKIALIGAGSRSFGPSSIRDICLSEPLARCGIRLALMDTDPQRLPEMAAYAKHVADKLGRKIDITATGQLDAALEGAQFAVTAIEVERFKYWTQDYHVPRKHGFRQVFGENGGPGGIFHALRNMGPLVEIARTMERVCPSAWLLNFGNPEHKLCEAVSRLSSIRNVGLCHGVFMGQHSIACFLERPIEELDTAACGINHFTWFQRIRDKRTGEDLYPALREAERKGDWLHNWHELALARILFRRFGLWPSPAPNHYGEYIRWAEEFVCSEMQYYYDPIDGPPWQTGDIPDFVYSLTGNPHNCPWIKPAPHAAPLEDAELKRSGELAIDIMEAIACNLPRHLDAVNIANNGAIPGLPDDMVVEVAAEADARGIYACQHEPLPEAIAAMIRLQGSINKLIVEAFAEKSKDKLIQAFLLDPTVDSYRRAIECIEEMLALQKELLPEFKN